MIHKEDQVQVLLSLPPAMSSYMAQQPSAPGAWFAGSDPPGRQLGSGGGTIHLLLKAWQATGAGQSFLEWLRASRKLIVHGGGRSRRLMAYGPLGKPFIPMPVMRQTQGQRLDQRLIDFQLDSYRQVLEDAPDCYRVMVTSGDVLLKFGLLTKPYIIADVLGLGMKVEPEVAQDFGVFFTADEAATELECFLQKPDAGEILRRMESSSFTVDSGMWLLSEEAIGVLLMKCGVDPGELSDFQDQPVVEPYELYAGLGLSLGKAPSVPDTMIKGLKSAVYTLDNPEFYHLGTNHQLIDSVATLQNHPDMDTETRAGWLRHPDVFVLNSVFDPPALRGANTALWVENSHVPSTWSLSGQHVITGAPNNSWSLQLETGVCLDFVPVGDEEVAVRAYGFSDHFSGRVGDATTRWFDRPISEWFARREISLVDAGIDAATDIHDAKLFVLTSPGKLHDGFLQWLVARRPDSQTEFATRWIESERVSAFELNSKANVGRILAQRTEMLKSALPAMQRGRSSDVFYALDLSATSDLLLNDLGTAAVSTREEGQSIVSLFGESDLVPAEPLMQSKDSMLRATLARKLALAQPLLAPALQQAASEYEANAFGCLHESLVVPHDLAVAPRRDLLEDQIVWARSPVRLDLGGGWTDTPPYCLQNGGRVVNIAVNLNGQPPIQVFAKVSENPQIVIRSIDLGVGQTVATYEELDTFTRPGSEFALAKAALAVAGFLPRFNSGMQFGSLTEQLTRFGGGIELSMVAAVPAGSGLGTSSILAATLLAALSEMCGLGWDQRAIVQRALALEQMLTTGGGWQDQVGGIFRGVKLIESRPGLMQDPIVRWLPEHLFSPHYANRSILLYYTGITRMAKNILQEIVRGMFLNSQRVLKDLQSIARNADLAHEAIQRGSYTALAEAVGSSWRSNKALDSGTNPEAVEHILQTIGDPALSAKLLGAGGGGYLLIFARDASAGDSIRDTLTKNPPNSRARFVDFSISDIGLQVTRS